MTSDAKIGLLLGLVFIFVIAFVINGLPSLRPPVTAGKVVTVLPNEDFKGVVGSTDQAVTSWSELLDQQKTSEEPAPVVEMPRPVVQELLPSQPAQTPLIPTQPAQTANNEGIRLSIPLGDLLSRLTPTIQNDQTNTINVDQPRSAPETPAVGGRQPAAGASQPGQEMTPAPGLVETPTSIESREPPKPPIVANKPPVIPGSKSYVVVEGDTLPAIARKMYGPDEGNRIVNIERVFQANLGILKSPSLVVVGQKLIIPPLPKPASPAAPAPGPAPMSPRNTPADVLPSALFEKPKPPSTAMTISEKVGSLAQRAPAALPAPLPDGRFYTVQDGDNLWKIAASQLGAGSRWDEIHKLNAALLPSQDSLKVGMRLRLPAK